MREVAIQLTTQNQDQCKNRIIFFTA